jgi:hypothetical protein
MAKPIILADRAGGQLGIDELEAGLSRLNVPGNEGFWDENVEAFRRTVIAAIRETCEILENEEMPERWREQLNRQVEAMRNYVGVADLYLAGEIAPPGRRLN